MTVAKEMLELAEKMRLMLKHHRSMSLNTSDQIILDHVKAAHELAKTIRRRA